MNCGTAKCGDVDKMRCSTVLFCSVLCDSDGMSRGGGRCGGGEGIQLSSRNKVPEAAVAIAVVVAVFVAGRSKGRGSRRSVDRSWVKRGISEDSGRCRSRR